MNTNGMIPLAGWRRRGGWRAGRSVLLACLISLGALTTSAGAAEGPFDFVFLGQARPARVAGQDRPQAWRLGEFSALRLVPIESGAAANQHPADLSPDWLQAQLERLRTGSNGTERLFGKDELEELVPVLAQAFKAARPEQDLLLLSTSRRGQGLLTPPLSLTARLYVSAGALHLLVGEERADLSMTYRQTRIVPQPATGSRATAGPAQLGGTGWQRRQAGWLQIGLPGTVAAVADPAASSGAAMDAGAAEASRLEQRLRLLKQLHEQGLISAEDYAGKRRALLDQL